MHIKEGFTMWARKTIEANIFQTKPDKWFKIWFYLVMRANHKTTKQYKRGSSWTSYEKIMEATGATKGQVDHCLRYLRKKEALATKKSTRGFNFTINKYDFYQNPANYQRDLDAKQKRFRRDTINKNAKNDKNENIIPKYRKFFYGIYDGLYVYKFPDGLKVITDGGEVKEFGGNAKDIIKNAE